jgi:hypothetical protein
MSDKKRVYESDVMALPPLRLVLGDIPIPDPDRRPQTNQKNHTPDLFERKVTVKRIITHLEKD